MINKKTGILSLSAAQNYGAVLQAFSLYVYLNKNYGKTEIINFVPYFIKGRYSLFKLDNTSLNNIMISLIKSIVNLPSNILKKYRFYSFKKKYCFFSKKYIGRIDADDYDQYIVGSDQVFNLTLTKNEIGFFLPFVSDNNKKATYAASIGLDNIDDNQAIVLKEYLADFSFLSFRENNGKRIIGSVLPQKIVHVNIDPVFLQTKDCWERVATERIYAFDYVLIYTFKSYNRCLELAKRLYPNKTIVCITNRIVSKGGEINARGIGPREFLSLIRNADFILTDSFHGTAFSIIFEKNFGVIPYPNTSSRMKELLSLFNLEDHLIESEMVCISSIDYKRIGIIIKREINQTKEYFNKVYYGG